MSELDDAKADWRDKRLDRIESLLDSGAAKVNRNTDMVAEYERRNADLIAENERKHAASLAKTKALIAENERNHAIARAKTEALIAENKIIIAESKETVAKMLEEMKWIPLKSGLWTVGIMISAIVCAAALPDAINLVMGFFGGK
ncbi:MAG: hypothetical protein ISN28_14695 [Ectothiorhodospiraceae bacterium AqS1]|nr:hypothetical protein [Ectothiorhodospiraceae bacterium AqS1]